MYRGTVRKNGMVRDEIPAVLDAIHEVVQAGNVVLYKFYNTSGPSGSVQCGPNVFLLWPRCGYGFPHAVYVVSDGFPVVPVVPVVHAVPVF